MGDCSKQITAEHFLSRSVLEVLLTGGKSDPNDPDYKRLKIVGFPWQKVAMQKVGKKTVVGKVLCERHNSALSCLDQLAKRFFKVFDQVAEEYFQSGNPDRQKDRIFPFHGHDVERWLLKTLCGLAASDNLGVGTRPIKAWVPDEQWLGILFGPKNPPQGWGLYFTRRQGEEFDGKRCVTVVPMLRDGEILAGVEVRMNSYPFVLRMCDVRSHEVHAIRADQIYRPGSIDTTDGRTHKALVFGWHEPGDGLNLEIIATPK